MKNKDKDTRPLAVRLKTAKKKTTSQQQWLKRQLNDPYVSRAKQEGWRSRAAYKLIEIDDKYRFLKPGAKVIDLGCAPGGWSQVAAKRIGSSGKIIGIDLLEMDPVTGVEFQVLDFNAPHAAETLKTLLNGKADIVLSDMAANTTGHKKTDHLRIVGLVELAAFFAKDILAPGGAFLAKVLQGGTENTLLASLKQDFVKVIHVKPPASRADSSELYVLATGFRGR